MPSSEKAGQMYNDDTRMLHDQMLLYQTLLLFLGNFYLLSQELSSRLAWKMESKLL